MNTCLRGTLRLRLRARVKVWVRVRVKGDGYCWSKDQDEFKGCGLWWGCWVKVRA